MSFKAGSRNFKAKLDEADVRKIYAAGDIPGVTQQQLADEYGVSQSCIAHIMLGYTWTRVTGHNKEWNIR